MLRGIVTVVFCFIATNCFCQTNAPYKECRLAAGWGLANPQKNASGTGSLFWMQLSYGIGERVLVATEFENMHYKQPGFYSPPADMNKINVYENNFSLLLKYMLLRGKKMKVMVGSGWTYCTRINDYFQEMSDGATTWFEERQYGVNDYRVPLYTDVEYPLVKTVNLQLRGRYNLNVQNGNTYSVGLGLSVKL